MPKAFVIVPALMTSYDSKLYVSVFLAQSVVFYVFRATASWSPSDCEVHCIDGLLQFKERRRSAVQ